VRCICAVFGFVAFFPQRGGVVAVVGRRVGKLENLGRAVVSLGGDESTGDLFFFLLFVWLRKGNWGVGTFF